jgi:transcriptional regulator with XRE-family HTH domain
MKDRIKALLINGLKASEIAKIVGCSAGYISQLMKDPVFQQEVAEALAIISESCTEEEHIDKHYERVEQKVLISIEEGLAEASLGEKVRALEAINKRTDQKHARKNPIAQQALGVTVNVVSLSLPNHAAQAVKPVVTLNEKQEIIAINNKPLAPMSSDAVKTLFAARQAVITDDINVVAEI